MGNNDQRQTLSRPSVGDRFGKLTVLEMVQHGPKRKAYICQCACGGRTGPIMAKHLRSGHTSSCGCNQREVATTTGLSNLAHGCKRRGTTSSRTYIAWMSMHRRVKDPNKSAYYGHVRVCVRWTKFENFLADMGDKPEGLTLDRYPDAWGDYEPKNCRWATWSEQRLNQRRCKK